MNLFDLVAGLILLVSAVLGYARGLILELVALFAFAGAAALSVYLLPFTAPLALASVRPVWIANAVAAGVSFLLAYLGLRLLGSSVSGLARRQATLGALDRTVGLAFGVTRGLAVMGVTYLVLSATLQGEPPPIMTQARLYPLARGSGIALASLAPGGLKELQGFGASLKTRMGGETPAPPDTPVEAGRDDGPPLRQPDGPARTLRIEGGSTSVRHRHHHPSDTPVE